MNLSKRKSSLTAAKRTGVNHTSSYQSAPPRDSPATFTFPINQHLPLLLDLPGFQVQTYPAADAPRPKAPSPLGRRVDRGTRSLHATPEFKVQSWGEDSVGPIPKKGLETKHPKSNRKIHHHHHHHHPQSSIRSLCWILCFRFTV